MKRFLFAALMVFATFTFTAVAQDSEKSSKQYKYEYQEAKISYHNVKIYRVLDHREAYIVLYAKSHREVGTAIIPKRWYNEHPRKLAFRALPNNMDPYLTVINKEGEFNYAILTMPTSRGNPVWGVADSNQEVDASVDTLKLEY